jgi:predicted PurR-regulated permease PerM
VIPRSWRRGRLHALTDPFAGWVRGENANVSILLPGGGSIGPDGQARPPSRPRSVSAVSARTVLTVLGITLAVLLVLSLGYLAWRAIASLFVAAFLAMALNPLVEMFERRGLGRGPAAVAVFVLALLVFGAVGFLLIPPLVRQMVDFVDALPGLIREADQGGGPLGFLERRFHVIDRLQAAADEGGAGAVFGFATPVIDVAKTALATAFSAFAIAFLTFFLLLDGRRWVNLLLGFVPDRTLPRWERVLDGIYRTVGGYVAGNLAISVCAGVVAGVTLGAVGVPYAIPLAVLVALLDLIPLVGAAIATAILGLVALTEGWLAAAIVVAVLLVYQQLENHVLQPLVYGRAVKLSALAVLVSVLIGAELAGILGALAAIPVGGSIAVIATELMRWRRESAVESPAGVHLAEDDPTGS